MSTVRIERADLERICTAALWLAGEWRSLVAEKGAAVSGDLDLLDMAIARARRVLERRGEEREPA